ncbi:hypothetical protein ES703_82134 [subsurface metagenome]
MRPGQDDDLLRIFKIVEPCQSISWVYVIPASNSVNSDMRTYCIDSLQIKIGAPFQTWLYLFAGKYSIPVCVRSCIFIGKNIGFMQFDGFFCQN